MLLPLQHVPEGLHTCSTLLVEVPVFCATV